MGLSVGSELARQLGSSPQAAPQPRSTQGYLLGSPQPCSCSTTPLHTGSLARQPCHSPRPWSTALSHSPTPQPYHTDLLRCSCCTVRDHAVAALCRDRLQLHHVPHPCSTALTQPATGGFARFRETSNCPVGFVSHFESTLLKV